MTQEMLMRRVLLIPAAAALVFLLQPIADGASNTGRSIKYTDLLNKEKMYDYSIFHLENAIAGKPADVERLKIQLALTYLLMNNPQKANRLMEQIPENSKYYPSAQLALGKAALQKGKFKVAEAHLKKYLSFFEKAPPKDEAGKLEYRTAVTYLAFIYKKQGKTDEAFKTEKLLERISDDPAEVKLRAISAKLDAAETMKENGKKGWKKIVEGTLPLFESIQWEAGQSAITLMSYVNHAKALYLLGKYDDALKMLSGAPELFLAYEKAFRQQGQIGDSPSAYATYWGAMVYFSKAQAEKDKKQQLRNYAKATKLFFKVLMKYRGFPLAGKAYSKLLACKDILSEKFGKNVTIPSGFKPPEAVAGTIIPGPVEQAFNDGDYARAVPGLLKAVQDNRDTPKVADAVYKLAHSYAATGNELEAFAMSGFLANTFAKEDIAPLGLLKIGEVFWNGNKKDAAIRVYEYYLDNMGAHRYAPEIATRIAKEYYDRATALTHQAAKLRGKAKKARNLQAIEAFKLVPPKCERIVKWYGNRRELGEAAFAMMTRSHAAANQFAQAASADLSFAKYMLDKDKYAAANAKLGAADYYYRGGQHEDKLIKELKEEILENPEKKDALETKLKKLSAKAAQLYKQSVTNTLELLDKWLVAGGTIGAPGSEPKLVKTAENAQLLLAWAYDSCNKKQQAANAFNEFVKKFPNSQRAPAAMSRMGVLYYEMNNIDKSTKVLTDLAAKYPDSKEAKNAYINLARNLYEMGKYEKCFEVVGNIFKDNVEVSVANLRWIASSLYECGGKHPKVGAALAYKAAKTLLGLVKKPEPLKDWVGAEKAAELKRNQAELQKTLNLIQDKLLLDAGISAFYAGQTRKALAHLNTLLKNDKTPYYYQALFTRADVFLALKQYERARRDLSRISATAMMGKNKKYSLATKAKCLIGETYMAQDNYQRPYSVFRMLARGVILQNKLKGASTPVGKAVKEEREKERPWLEYAIYHAALCASKLNKPEEAEQYLELYKKEFPEGKYIKDATSGKLSFKKITEK